MKALTIHAPWAWAILSGHKRFENRTWPTSYRGPLAIHAGSSQASDATATHLMEELGIAYPADWCPFRGRLLGVVELTRIFDTAETRLFDPIPSDPWITGPMAWEFARPRWLAEGPFMLGKQGLWDVALEDLQ